MLGKENLRPQSSGSAKATMKMIFERFGILLILLAMMLVLTILEPTFLNIKNLTNILRQITVITILSYGVTNIIITGGIDLGLGAYVALSAVLAAKFAQPESNLPVIVPILIGLATGTAVGIVNGTIISKCRIPPFIVTLGMTTIARGAAMLYANGKPISGFSHEFKMIGGGDVYGIPVPILILIVMTVLSHLLLNNTKFGKYTRAIGGNENAAVISGVNVDKIKIMVYAFSGFCCGLAGLILCSRVDSAQPGSAVGYELDAIASTVIGGTSLSGGIGTVFGALIGSMIIGVLNTGLNLLNVSAYWQQILKGVIIICAVILDERKNRGK